MILLGREQTFENCERDGEIVTQANLDAGHFPGNEAFVREWLLRKADERRARLEAELARRADRAVEVSEESARASKRSAQFAMWSALISVVAIAVAVVRGCTG
jgi:hypothetical protein